MQHRYLQRYRTCTRSSQWLQLTKLLLRPQLQAVGHEDGSYDANQSIYVAEGGGNYLRAGMLPVMVDKTVAQARSHNPAHLTFVKSSCAPRQESDLVRSTLLEKS